MPDHSIRPGRHEDPVAGADDVEPVLEPAHHQRADRGHRRGVATSGRPARQPPFHRLGDGDRAGHREVDRRVDVDPVGRRLLDRNEPRGRDRELDLHVGGERVEPCCLVNHRRRVAIASRADLDGQASLPTAGPREDRCQHPGAPDGDLLGEPPGDLVLGRRRGLCRELVDPGPPRLGLLSKRIEDQRRVGGCANGAIGERVLQLARRARVVPDVGRRLRGDPEERTAVRALRAHGDYSRCPRAALWKGAPGIMRYRWRPLFLSNSSRASLTAGISDTIGVAISHQEFA